MAAGVLARRPVWGAYAAFAIFLFWTFIAVMMTKETFGKHLGNTSGVHGRRDRQRRQRGARGVREVRGFVGRIFRFVLSPESPMHNASASESRADETLHHGARGAVSPGVSVERDDRKSAPSN